MSLNRDGHRCSTAGVWLPRVLAGAVLVAAVIASRTMDPDQVFASSRIYRGLVVLLGAVIALWIVRDGAIVGWSVRPAPEGVEFTRGGKRNLLEYRDIVHIDYHPPFSSGRHWLPAMVLEDRLGTHWRVPSFIGEGGVLVQEILKLAGRNELDAWADARGIARRMGRGIGSLKLWYAVAATVLAWGLAFPLL